TEKALAGATVEILTRKNALVTMLTPDPDGRARYTVKEGQYRVRVTHPGLAPETRQVHVQGGQTAELHVRLRAAAPLPPPRRVEAAPTERAGFFRRLFR
ncbi:MAG: carboxypeptidase-like regulatory domain-containing protein, partial [Candidatus Rokuibacteriota bacterium]